MRKSLLIVLAVMFVAAISSCTKKYVTPNTNTTLFATVKANSWVLDPADGGSYSSQILVPALDDQYNDDGAVLVYMSFENGVYEQIPQVYAGQSFSYYHTTGKVVLYSQAPNGGPATPPNRDITVKIVLIDSNY
jgi:hypothetical protein